MRRIHNTYCRVLTIAGSDSGAGAGIQADLKTISAIGCYGMSAITALTAQNTTGVLGIHPIPGRFVAEQISAVLTDMGAGAIKIGMLYSGEIIEAVASALRAHEPANIVLDTVMAAQSGDELSRGEIIEGLKKHLMPLADIVTPNLPEAEILLDRQLESADDIRQGARDLAGYGSRHVLIKGGHSTGEDSNDLLYSAAGGQISVLAGKRLETGNDHGTGCTLSSAIAAFLARGDPMETAVAKAKSYVEQALRAGAKYTIGRGRGPVQHFFGYWECVGLRGSSRGKAGS